MNLSSSTLRRAADLQERIEGLQQQLATLLQTGEAPTPTPSQQPDGRRAPVASSPKQGRKANTAATTPRGRRGRRGSPSGPLSDAVVNVLKAKGAPMGVSEILEGLLANGYQYPSPEPKKNLFARIYRLKGVKQVGPGRFAAE